MTIWAWVMGVAAGRDDLHPALGHRVQHRPRSAGRVLATRPVDGDGMLNLHALAGRFDDGVGGGDDVAGGAVVVGELAPTRAW